MINQYYLTKKLLTSNIAKEELIQDTDLDSIFADEVPELPKIEIFKQKVESIIHLMSTLWVEDLQSLSGADVSNLFSQRDYIISKLSEISYAETLIINGHTFKEVLEGLLGTTLEHVEDYERAEAQLTGKRIVVVMAENKEARLPCKTEIEDNIITLEKCQDIVNKVKEHGFGPTKLHFFLSVYTETKGNECGDFAEECLLNRDVYYYVEGNTLMVWEHGKPVLQNVNGIINTDQGALADCFL